MLFQNLFSSPGFIVDSIIGFLRYSNLAVAVVLLTHIFFILIELSVNLRFSVGRLIVYFTILLLSAALRCSRSSAVARAD